MATAEHEVFEGEVVAGPITNSESLMALNASEIDTQIATAKRYPRSLKLFRREALEMVTLTEEVAGECIYSLPRGGKAIEGPSARFAEVVASAWGNCRAGARVISEDDRFVTSQGVFIDLQRNSAVTYEVKRRITDKGGKKFKDDMIGVTSNAACSIALRNAVLKGVPKAFWRDIYAEARKCAIGDVTTLATRRASMVDAFGKMGVVPQQICDLLEVGGVEDINLDHIATLRGMFTALKEGDTTIDQLFGGDSSATGAKASKSDLDDKIAPASEPHAVSDLEEIRQEILVADAEKVAKLYDFYVGPNGPLGAADTSQVSAWCKSRSAELAKAGKSSGVLFDDGMSATEAGM